MLLVMWLAGCSLVAVDVRRPREGRRSLAARLRGDHGRPGHGAGRSRGAAAPVGHLAARRSHAWASARSATAARTSLILLGLGAVLMLVVDRFAALSVGLSAFFVTDGAAGSRTLRSATLAPPDPIARDFARVRREESHLTVASISPAGARGRRGGSPEPRASSCPAFA